MYHYGLQSLRAKLRGFHASSVTLTSRMKSAQTTERRGMYQCMKHALGHSCRHHLIAYGLLRGLTYDQIERCSPQNRPSATLVLKIMLEHNGMMEVRKYGEKLTGGGYQTYDLAKVEALLVPGTQAAPERAA